MSFVSLGGGDRWRQLAAALLAIYGMTFVARILLRVIRWPFAAMVWEERKVVVYALLAVVILWLASRFSPVWRRFAAGSALFCGGYYFVLSIRLARSADWWGTREDSDVFSGLAATRGAALALVAIAVALFAFDRRAAADAREVRARVSSQSDRDRSTAPRQ